MTSTQTRSATSKTRTRSGGVRSFPRSIDDVYVAAAIAVVAAAALLTTISPHDFWWHLAYARMITETGSIPLTDSFTWSHHGEPFFNQMWLAQLVMLALYRGGGIAAVLVGHAAVIVMAYFMLLRLCLRLGASRRLASVILLAVVLPLSFTNWAVRPQAYAFPLFVFFLSTLWTFGIDRTSTRRLWLLPFVMAVWVNVHGSFPLGLAMYGLTIAVAVLRLDAISPRDRRQLHLWAAPTFAAVLANPRGSAVIGYVRNLLTSAPVTEHVTEWQPTGLHDLSGWVYFAVVAAVMFTLAYGGRRPPVRHLLLTAVFILLGFTATRHTIWAALVLTPLLAQQLRGRLADRDVAPGTSAAVDRVVLVLLLVLVMSASPWVRPQLFSGRGELLTETPAAATAFLGRLPDSQKPTRLYNDLGYGSYITWAAPHVETFIDPRFELFSVEEVQDAVLLGGGRFVDQLVEKYAFDGFFLNKSEQQTLIDQLRADTRWRVAHEDAEAIILLPEQ